MAPQIPFNEPKKPSTEDKLDAAVIVLCVLCLAVMFLTIAWVGVSALWHAGFTNFVVVIGIFAGLLAIGRAIYRSILEKDFN